MNPPQVLVECSAVQALCDPTSEHHARVATAYLALLDDFERDKLLLVAVGDHLRPHRGAHSLTRRGPLAPIDTLHVGRQHRRVARRMATAPDFDTALTLVMCQRHKVARVLTINPYFTNSDLDVQLVGGDDDAGL